MLVEQSQCVVAEPEFAREDGPDDGVRRAVEVGEKIAGGEGQEEPEPQLATVGCGHYSSGFT